MEARDFSTGTNYAKGNLCMYGGILYRFTAAHPAGAWTGSDVEEVDNTTEQELTRILAGINNAEKAADYADTVVFAPSQIEGTRYKYILTNAPDPRD
jgi:hypothetical protein